MTYGMSFLLTCLVLASPLLYLLIGDVVYAALWRILKLRFVSEEKPQIALHIQCMLGLLSFLALVHLLLVAGLSLSVASMVSYVPGLFAVHNVKSIFSRYDKKITVNFLLWCTIVISLGISLFQFEKGSIQTPWLSNYGDLAFHLGMISFFEAGQDILTQFHLLPGHMVSYPFYVNLWAASFWWIHDSFASLSFIFLVQWVLLWIVVYRALQGDKNWLLPWALLLGGGSLLYGSLPAAELIQAGKPWTPFLNTIWVTQRSALMGAAAILSACSSGWLPDSEESDCHSCTRALLCGCILGLSPLAHTHFLLIAALFLGLVWLQALCRKALSREPLKSLLLSGFYFSLGLSLAVISLPWLLSKTGIMSLQYGWMPGAQHPQLSQLVGMWLEGAGVWFLCLFCIFSFRRNRPFILPFLVLFLAANCVRIAVWDWDQIKIFVALYALSLFLWSRTEHRVSYIAQSLVVLLIAPTIFSSFSAIQKRSSHTVFSADDVRLSRSIRSSTPPGAIIAARPDHNSPVVLSGRALFMGYPGTLSSHGLEYRAVEQINRRLSSIAQCKNSPTYSCPGYVLWTEREERYWNQESPDQYFVPTENHRLFKVQ